MFNTHSVEIDWGGRPLRLETGKIARQADGAVMATYGETVVLATVVAARTRERSDKAAAAFFFFFYCMASFSVLLDGRGDL